MKVQNQANAAQWRDGAYHALLAVLADVAALSPDAPRRFKSQKRGPRLRLERLQEKILRQFCRKPNGASAAHLDTATTREATVPAPAERPQLGDLFAMDPNVEEPVSWRDLFVTKTVPIKYRKRQGAEARFYKAAEREHGRAALLGAAFISSVAWDARLGPLVLFARCGCPQALNQFAEGAPNALVEGPLAAMSLAYLLRAAPVLQPRCGDEGPRRLAAEGARGYLCAELFQGRVGDARARRPGRAPRDGPQHTVSEAVGDVVTPS